MTKKRKIILLIILAIAIIFFVKLAIYEIYKTCGDCGKPIVKNPVTADERLNDPDLLYTSFSSFGLCRNEKGEEGGCYTKYYLYTTGKLVKEIGFTGIDGKKTITPSERYLSITILDQIRKQLKNSDVMNKDCPPRPIMDASWDYQINLAGVKKTFHNPAQDCQDIFDKIDQIIDL